MSIAADYSAQKAVVDGIEVVRLSDAAHGIEVAIVPIPRQSGLRVQGERQECVLAAVCQTLAEMQAKPQFGGIPFLAPWANRLSEDAFFANGKKYRLNPDLGNIRRDQNQHPIHGLLNVLAGLEGYGNRGRYRFGAGDQPPGILETSRLDGAVSVRAHDRDDLRLARRTRWRSARRSRISPPIPCRWASDFIPTSSFTTRRATSGRCTWPRAITWCSRRC